jgi:hypothetical protein
MTPMGREEPTVQLERVTSRDRGRRAWIASLAAGIVLVAVVLLSATAGPRPAPSSALTPTESPSAFAAQSPSPTSPASPAGPATPWPSDELAAFGPFGIPLTIGPGMPVLSPAEARTRAQNAVDSSSFLVGGWTSGMVEPSCALTTRSSPRPSLDPACRASYTLADAPGPLTTAASPLLLVNPDRVDLPAFGGLVLAVHAADPRSADCSAATLAACRATLVIERLVWLGQAFSAANPPLPSAATPCQGLSPATCASVETAVRDKVQFFPWSVASIATFSDRPRWLPTACTIATAAVGVTLVSTGPFVACFNLIPDGGRINPVFDALGVLPEIPATPSPGG